MKVSNLWSEGPIAQRDTIHFTPPIASYEYGGMIYRTKVANGMFTLLAPFTTELWLAIVAGIGVVALLIPSVLRKRDGEALMSWTEPWSCASRGPTSRPRRGAWPRCRRQRPR